MSSGKEPAAKMVKQEEDFVQAKIKKPEASGYDKFLAKMMPQEDYTRTRRSEFNRFMVALFAGGNHFFPPKVIDGVEVITKVGIILANNQLVLEMFADTECRNSLMFHKQCGVFHYEMFKKTFYSADENGLMDFHAGFNELMAFVVKEVPQMKLYGNKLVTAPAYSVLTSTEEEFFEAMPGVFRCGRCGQINNGKLLAVDAMSGMENAVKGACLKCYIQEDRNTQFDTDVDNHMLDYDHDKFVFDRLGSCKFAEIVEGGLIHQDMYDCECHDEDEEEDHDEDDDDDDDDDDEEDQDNPPPYNAPAPANNKNAGAAA
jgi:hypothetical protein